MKNKLFTLTKAGFSSLLSPAKIFSVKGEMTPTKKLGYSALFAFICVCVAGAGGFACSFLYDKFSEVNLQSAIPCLFFILSTALILMTGLFSASGFLFKANDIQQLFAMPISYKDILISKFIVFYTYELLFSLITVGISGVVYLIKSGLTGVSLLTVIFGIFLTPLLPSTVGVLVSFGLGFCLRNFKYRKQFTTILTVAFSAGLILIFYTFDLEAFAQKIINDGGNIIDVLKGIYFPCGLYVNAFSGEIIDLLLFAAINILPPLLILLLISQKYPALIASYNATSVKTKYKYTSSKKQSNLFITILKKEIAHVFSSAQYILNSCTGILCLVLVTALSNKIETLLQSAEDVGSAPDYFPLVILLLTILFVTMISSSVATISIEAKTMWILKSTPINVRTVFDAKALTNFVIYAPFTIAFTVIDGLILDMSPVNVLIVIFAALASIMFSSYLGLVVNLRFPKFDWTNEVQAIKQSASALISLLIGICSSIVVIILSIVVVANKIMAPDILICCIFLLYAIVAFILRYVAMNWGIRKFNTLF